MPKYEGSINGQKVEIRVDFTIASKLNGLTPKHKVKEREISIDDITLTPLSSANIGLLRKL
ncbi:MAG UNVERIFIED_CONTAM: hypothetical protein LVQ98_01140 [Rickettsiaceae bacterium]|jgi:hypothetical protein